ncbi:MAG: hypothetical protein Q8L14_38575 [Myxococcales bacterium]|nr:hypothetical protein [Myxococcales bacterium]
MSLTLALSALLVHSVPVAVVRSVNVDESSRLLILSELEGTLRRSGVTPETLEPAVLAQALACRGKRPCLEQALREGQIARLVAVDVGHLGEDWVVSLSLFREGSLGTCEVTVEARSLERPVLSAQLDGFARCVTPFVRSTFLRVAPFVAAGTFLAGSVACLIGSQVLRGELERSYSLMSTPPSSVLTRAAADGLAGQSNLLLVLGLVAGALGLAAGTFGVFQW